MMQDIMSGKYSKEKPVKLRNYEVWTLHFEATSFKSGLRFAIVGQVCHGENQYFATQLERSDKEITAFYDARDNFDVESEHEDSDHDLGSVQELDSDGSAMDSDGLLPGDDDDDEEESSEDDSTSEDQEYYQAE